MLTSSTAVASVPNQRPNEAGFVHASKTASGEALNVRVIEM
jgi:hypothetical protein